MTTPRPLLAAAIPSSSATAGPLAWLRRHWPVRQAPDARRPDKHRKGQTMAGSRNAVLGRCTGPRCRSVFGTPADKLGVPPASARGRCDSAVGGAGGDAMDPAEDR